jgi:PAS domain S-box-containing protein
MDRSFEKSRTEISFRDMIEFAPVGILIFQKDLRIKYVNKNFFFFNGVRKIEAEKAIGESLDEFEIFDGIDLKEELQKLKEGEAIERVLTASKTIRGGSYSLILKGTPIIIDDEPNGGLLILEDLKSDQVRSPFSLLQSSDFQNFLLQLCDYFIICDSSGNVKFAPFFGETYSFLFEAGTSVDSAGKKLSSLLFKNHLESVVQSNKLIYTQIPYLKNDEEINSTLTLVPFSETGLDVDWVIILIKDSENSDADFELNTEKLNELSKYEKIASDIVDGLIGVNQNGKIIFWNPKSENLFGLTKSEVYGKALVKMFPQINDERFNKIKTLLEAIPVVEEKIRIGVDEEIAEYYLLKFTLFSEKDDKEYIIACTDITQSEKTQLQLVKSEEKFRNIVTNSHDYICTLNSRGKITYANPHFLKVFEYTANEVTNLNFANLIDPYYSSNNSFSISSILENEQKTIELPLKGKNGQPIYVLASFSEIEDPSDVSGFYNVILTDITIKKESEKDLLLIRSVFEASLDGIALLSKRKIVLINDSFVDMFGFQSVSDVIGMNILSFVAKKDAAKLTKILEKSENGEQIPNRFDFSAQVKNNTQIEIEASVTSYQIENENFTVWILRDISEEKKAEEILKLSEERYRSISENINEFIWTAVNRDGKLVVDFYTHAVKKITSYTAEQFIEDPQLWKKILHPDDASNFVERLKSFYSDKARTFEKFEYRIIDALGNVLWIENRITLIRNLQGEIQRIFGVVSDNTLSNRAEEELKNTAAKLKELNDTKDRFISIISHDLRTPFSSILGFADILINNKEMELEKRQEYIQFIKESSKSMLSLVNSLLDWTRLQTGRIRFEPERIDIRNVISKSIQITSGAAIPKSIKLNSQLNKEIFVHADESLMLQVFNNLLSNAIKFTQNGGEVNIYAHPNIEKRQIEFSVKDNGIGIKKENVDKLFKVDTKFTTAGTAGEKGSGLGLSLVAEIIHKHGGDIWVNSEYGKGTEFIFSIPVASSNILLVDDGKTDRILYSKLIKTLVTNYNILEAENGQTALQIIKQNSPALVITDHQMPVMNGYDLVKQINMADLKFKPPVIILSSDINIAIEAEYKNMGVEFIFQKPVSLALFKKAIESSLRKALYN